MTTPNTDPTISRPATPRPDEEPRDLGFGSVVGGHDEKRLLNRNGTFNVRREGLGFFDSLSLYHTALTMTWPRFLAVLVGGYLLLNTIFATGFMLAGPGALVGIDGSHMGGDFGRAFFFSVHTFATIGYGNVSPNGLPANILVTLESIVGLLGFALSTGLLFARFSRPEGRIVFSRRGVIAPYRGMTAFMFRIANARRNQIIELEAKVLFSRIQGDVRRYDQLTLERSRVVFFPLSWTVVHPIDAKSPLWGLTQREMEEQDAEFLIMLSGTDETFAQMVHARSSYKPDEIAFGAKFSNIYNPVDENGVVSIDVARLSEVEPAVDAGLGNETGTWHHTGHFTGFAPPRR